MTIKVTDEGIIDKRPKNYTRNVLIIIAIPVVAYILFVLTFAFTLGSFQVSGNLSDERKASLAESALMPEIAEYIERDGWRGFQDPDHQIETRVFANIDELVAAIPSLECYKDSPTSSGHDAKGKSAKIYEIDKISPRGRSSVLPLDFSHIDSDSTSLMEDWTYTYRICEYKDGSCRFVILIVPY